MLLGSSYFDGGREHRKEFARAWHWNTINATLKPSRIVIIAEGGGSPCVTCSDIDIVHLTGDLGHIGSHLNQSRPHAHTGWTASMIALAMLAYVDEADFLYKEQDCIEVGPCREQAYKDMGDGDMVFGGRQTSAPWMRSSQAFFLVRHSFIPTLVSRYLAMGRDRVVLGEDKFARLEDEFGTSRIRRLSFGVDRCRPIPWDNPPLYFQQPSDEDLNEAQRRGVI